MSKLTPIFAALCLVALTVMISPASAQVPEAPNCPTLPLWDNALCLAGWGLDTVDATEDWATERVEQAKDDWNGAMDEGRGIYDFLRCDVIGGPACSPLLENSGLWCDLRFEGPNRVLLYCLN